MEWFAAVVLKLFSAFAYFLTFLGINPAHLAAGLLGAAVKLAVDKTRSKIEIVTTLFVGGICASYLTPFINIYVGTSDIQQNNGMAFFIGTTGVYLTQYAIKVSQRYAVSGKLPKVAEQFGPNDDKSV